MKKLSSFFAVLIFALPVWAQIPKLRFEDLKSQSLALAQPVLPIIIQTQPRNHMRRDFWVLAGAIAGLDVADAATSEEVFRRGGHEVWGAWEMGRYPGTARMALSLAAEWAVWNGSAYLLERHHHHHLARIAQLAGVGAESEAVINNILWLGKH